ncbi:hypothetical protein [Nitrosomonas sp.]|uniref:hypothetical protein n=1 Tax=Nitrosomonas sp. TaxID=42353 RepID=UPI0020844CFD|nr:hypothetical protein [Nitrosomonas sp.]GJL76083.1 MAG: hypothetical protein NMNS02_21890 [Nitrosomonas sp.]
MNSSNAAAIAATQTADNNPVAESIDDKHQLIHPVSGHRAIWKLKHSINTLDFLSQELAHLKNLKGIVLAAGETIAIDSLVSSILEEVEGAKDSLSTSDEVEILKPVTDDVNLAIDHLAFLLRVFEHDDGDPRELYGSDIHSICLNLDSVKDILSKLYKQIEKFAQYGFQVDADLYKEGFNVTTGLDKGIKNLDVLIKRFSGNKESKLKVLRNRKKTTKKVRRLCEAAWTLMNALLSDNQEKQCLVRAHDDLFHIFQVFRSEDILIDQNDLDVFSRILGGAKENYDHVLGQLLEQERDIKKSGGIH